MPIKDILQPETITISDALRLRKYDGNYAQFLAGYRDPFVYQNSEGIFDEDKIPDLDYVHRMCDYLDNNGELYLIEIKENGSFVTIGDVTVKTENPPIAIWSKEYRNGGIGTKVIGAVIARLKQLGFSKITGTTVYKYNLASQKFHEKAGFKKVGETDEEFIYERDL